MAPKTDRSDAKHQPKTASDRERVRFVLVEPRFAGNVGAAARALKNLGFRRLDLVAPACDPTGEEAQRLAVGAADLLQEARIHPTLDVALEGAGTVVGTSRRVGKQRRPHWRLDHLAPRLAGLASAGDVAFVFGRETHGLSDAELDRCTHLVHLLASEENPSFNLAQAVLLAAYEMRGALIEPAEADGLETPADHASREAMYAHLEIALRAIGFLQGSASEGMMRRLRRILGRAALTPGDVNVVRGIARQTLWLATQAGIEVEEPSTADAGTNGATPRHETD
jgi:TrmH family RNA methyltransferase